MKSHKHRAKTETTVCWSHPANPYQEDRRAHGAVTHVATCACGATRRIDSNGRFQERGEWVQGETL